MLTALRLTLMLAIAGAAGAAHALGSPEWEALEGTAQNSLEYARIDEPAPWVNPDSGTEGTFTPVATHEGPEGQVCREYAIDAIIDGREEVVYGTACRQPDGTWLEATAEYSESDSPVPTTTVYSGVDWLWIIPSIAISSGYCSSSFCVGGHFGSYYPSWYDPWGISFSYWDYGRWGYYYPYYPYYYSYYGHRHYYTDVRYVSNHRHDYQDEHKSHFHNGQKDRHQSRHSVRADSRDRKSHRDRPTGTRSRDRLSVDDRYAGERTESRKERAADRYVTNLSRSRSGKAERAVSSLSRTRSAKAERAVSSRSGNRSAKAERAVSNRSGNRPAKAERAVSSRSGNRPAKAKRAVSNRSGNNRRANNRSGSGRPSGIKRGARPNNRH
jgi:surface antigen